MEVSLIPSAPGHSSQHFWADPINFPLKIFQVLLLLDEPKNSVWPCPEFFLEDFTKLFMTAACFTVKYLYWHLRHPWVLRSLFFSWKAQFFLPAWRLSPRKTDGTQGSLSLSLSRDQHPCSTTLFGAHSLVPPCKDPWGTPASRPALEPGAQPSSGSRLTKPPRNSPKAAVCSVFTRGWNH